MIFSFYYNINLLESFCLKFYITSISFLKSNWYVFNHKNCSGCYNTVNSLSFWLIFPYF